MISLCITTYNRTDLLYESFQQVINDDRISEIVIVDDHSTDEIWNTIFWQFNSVPKVKLYRNEKNIDCYRNKREAISKSSNPWVIILDSDNIIDKSYIDALFRPFDGMAFTDWDKKMIYTPEFAKPHFDFRHLSGKVINSRNIGEFILVGNTSTMLNAMNYFVNRDEYLRVFDNKIDPVTSDSIYQNYRWLMAGNSIYVAPGMQYFHRVHPGSHYQNNVRRTPHGFHDSIIKKLKEPFNGALLPDDYELGN